METRLQLIQALQNVNDLFNRNEMIRRFNEDDVEYDNWNDLECYIYYLENYFEDH